MALSPMVKIREITRINPSTGSPKSAEKSSFPSVSLTYFFSSFHLLIFSSSTYFPNQPQALRICTQKWSPGSSSPFLLHFSIISLLPVSWPSDSPKPVILYTPNDGVSLTVAESSARSFDTLSGYDILKANELHAYVPELMISDDIAEMISLQIILFPNQGSSMGLKFHHLVADDKGMIMFIESWGHLFKQRSKADSSLPPQLTPFLDRRVVPAELDSWIAASLSEDHQGRPNRRSLKSLQKIAAVSNDLVRATFVPSREAVFLFNVSYCKRSEFLCKFLG